MTNVVPGSDWDDDRLDAAFASRAAATPPTPVELVDEVLRQLPRGDRPGLRWGLTGMAAALTVAAVLIGTLILTRPPVGPRALGSGVPQSAEPQTGLPTTAVMAALGDPITVSAALEVRVSGVPGWEIVVQGFLSPAPAVRCRAGSGPQNPTFLRCPQTFQWLMKGPEQLVSIDASSMGIRPPTGPAFHPSFALVEAPDVPMPNGQGVTPVPVALVGHFQDRRAELCPGADRNACDDTFMVDRVASVSGVEQPVNTVRRIDGAAVDLEEDVDALVAGAAPGNIVISRLLVPVDEVIPLEPVLANDQFIPYVSRASTPVWLVTTLDFQDGLPTTRTFALIDGSSWFAEITRSGATMLERKAPEPTGSAKPVVLPSADPTAFDGAPTTVLGIAVLDIATLERDRQAAADGLGRDELAVRAWYIGPPPGAKCGEPTPAIHAPTAPCDAARHWLLDNPTQYYVEPGQLRTNPATNLWPPVLNPLVPVDVPLDVGETWLGNGLQPQPVVVLGHFDDTRVDGYAGNVYFVIDSLAWSRERPAGSLDSFVRLTTDTTEDLPAVLARIDALIPKQAAATWATVVDATDFAALESRRHVDMPELDAGRPVWIIQRLVPSEMDGRQRLAVEWAWTQDGASRIWWTESPDSGPTLETSLDIHDLDGNTTLLQVFDDQQQIASIAPVAGLGSLSWHTIGPVPDFIDIARGRSDREVVIRWKGAACETTWRMDVSVAEHSILINPYTHGEGCDGAGPTVLRRIVIEFDHPVDLDWFRTTDPCCG